MNTSDPPDPYTNDELAVLRQQLADTSRELTCPRCRGKVTLDYPMGGGTLGEYWQLDCRGCGRTGVVGNVPKSRQPPKPSRGKPPK